MGPSAALLTHTLFDALRYLAQTMLLGFAIVGAVFCGGTLVYGAWHRHGRNSARATALDDSVAREAAVGITEIEAFLSTQEEPWPRGPEPLPPDVRRNDDNS